MPPLGRGVAVSPPTSASAAVFHGGAPRSLRLKPRGGALAQSRTGFWDGEAVVQHSVADRRCDGRWLHGAKLLQCGKAATMPVEPEEGAMARSVHHKVVPGAGAPSYMSVRASTDRGLAGLFDGRLTFLGSSASGWFGAFGWSATPPIGIGT